ncbi:MAG: YncE family protein [Candidatus Methylomirabilia bacterium]
MSPNGLLRVLDTATLTEVTTITLDAPSVRLAFNRPGERLYVVNEGTVNVIEPQGNLVVASIPIFAFCCARNMVFSLDGTKAYVGRASVFVLDLTTNSVLTTVFSGTFVRALALSPDGQRVFATTEFPSAQVAVIDTATDQVIATLAVGGVSTVAGTGLLPINVTFSPDGARAWVVNTLDDTISVIE